MLTTASVLDCQEHSVVYIADGSQLRERLLESSAQWFWLDESMEDSAIKRRVSSSSSE